MLLLLILILFLILLLLFLILSAAQVPWQNGPQSLRATRNKYRPAYASSQNALRRPHADDCWISDPVRPLYRVAYLARNQGLSGAISVALGTRLYVQIYDPRCVVVDGGGGLDMHIVGKAQHIDLCAHSCVRPSARSAACLPLLPSRQAATWLQLRGLEADGSADPIKASTT